MQDLTPSFREGKKLIDKASRIVLLSHRRPDGDTLGANCALHLALRSLGKETVLACVDTPTERFSFLPDIHKLVKEFDFRSFDLIIVCDAGAHYMTQYHEIYPGIFSGEIPVLNIDHHASNDYFGTLNIVDPESASATVIVYQFLRFLNIPITPAIATALLAGIYNDTGSFMHSNTTQDVYHIGADLVQKGAKVHPISKYMFRSHKLSSLKLWGRVLENMKITADNVAVSVLRQYDFKELGSDVEEAGGVIDLLNSVPGIKFSLLLCEDEKGFVKGSLRTQRNDVDLSTMAGIFGGGGHRKASGFSVPGHIEQEVRWKIVSDDGKELPLKLLAGKEIAE